MKSIYSMTYSELEDFFTFNGYKKFKAKQVYDWLYKKRVNSFKEMYNVSKKVIELFQNFEHRRNELIHNNIGCC